MANAEIVSIGSELLLGQIVDTNSAWMAQRLTDCGVDMFYQTTVGDNRTRMSEVISRALCRSDIVINGGGLGPTQDDITREVIADVTNQKLVRAPSLVLDIEELFRRRGFILTPNNERQADIPEKAIPVHNPNGTAPSFIVEEERGVVFALPGVPHEMKWLFDNEVVPYLRKRFALNEVITYRVLKVANLGESAVDDKIGHLIAESVNPTVGVLAHPGQVDVRIAAKAANADEASKLIDPVETQVRELLGQHVFAVDRETMEESLGALLDETDLTVAAYEDITSGALSLRLQQAGKDNFIEGVIANGSNSVHRFLSNTGVVNIEAVMGDPESLAKVLANSMRTYASASFGIAIHGIPAEIQTTQNLGQGETYIAITDGTTIKTQKYNMAGRGGPDQDRLSLYGVGMLRQMLLER